MDGHDVLRAFAGSVAGGPARIALQAGARRISYRDLDEWTDALARALRPAGPGAVVAVCAGDPLAWAAALIGVLKAGCVFAPLDLAQPPARLLTVLRQLAPRWFVGSVTEAPGGSAGGADDAAEPAALAVLQAVGWSGEVGWCRLDTARLAVTAQPPGAGSGAAAGGAIAPGAAAQGAAAPPPADPCYVFQTSGSTGVPKLIAGRYEAIGHFVRWEVELLGLGPGVRVSQLAAPHFDAWLRDVFTPLACGGTVCVPPAAEVRLDAAALADWIEREGIEVLHCVPSLFHLVAAGELAPERFARLRAVLLAGEAPVAADLARWFAVFGRRVRLVNLYGPSETTMTKLFHEIVPHDLGRRAIPAGRPMPGAAVLLVDRRGRPAAPGAVGEILLRTPYAALGYLGQPEATAAAFVPNPWSDGAGDRVYRTGDLGRLLPDGAVDLLGRRDQQVKVRGQRVEIGEIEAALAAHPAVAAAAVAARRDGEGLPALWGFVVTGEELAPRALRDWLLARLPAALIPDRFVRLPALPRLGSGKVDRRALAALDVEQPGAATPPLAPRNPTEEQLLAIWHEVTATRGAGVRDDFFAAGGHSLLAARLLLRVRHVFGVEVPLVEFFDHPTIEDLAANVEERMLARADPAELAALLGELDGAGAAAP